MPNVIKTALTAFRAVMALAGTSENMALLDAVLERRVRLLMAAFDPCVPFDVMHTLPAGQEVQHA